MAEKSQKPLSYFFTRRKQSEDESDKESTTMQVAHEDFNVDDPTKEIATKAKRKLQPRWLKSYSWLDYDQENNSMKCSLCEYVG